MSFIGEFLSWVNSPKLKQIVFFVETLAHSYEAGRGLIDEIR